MTNGSTGIVRGTARAAAILLAAVLVSGCATSKPIWFIATPGYVDAQVATSEEATRQEYEQRIRELEQELAAQRDATRGLSDLADVVSEIEQSNRELLSLADEVEVRLSELPDETIRRLVEILETHLEDARTP